MWAIKKGGAFYVVVNIQILIKRNATTALQNMLHGYARHRGLFGSVPSCTGLVKYKRISSDLLININGHYHWILQVSDRVELKPVPEYMVLLYLRVKNG